MIGHVFLQQHTRLDIIVGSPMFTNKDLVFVNKADPSVRAELYVWGFERYDLAKPFGKPFSEHLFIYHTLKISLDGPCTCCMEICFCAVQD
jgi:hypothetical protein